jgi:hypothetical protein
MPKYRITGAMTRTCNFDVVIDAPSADRAIGEAHAEAWSNMAESELDASEVEIYDVTEIEEE